ncbi:MAG: pilus assembly FimT family protein, partial [Phycisphaerales bacterium]
MLIREARVQRGYTLVEMLVVVTILGIAGALLVPAFGQTDTLRLQGAVRTLVSDITVAQSDSIAFQRSIGIQFTSTSSESSYVVAMVNGNELDVDLDRVSSARIDGEKFGFAHFDGTNFGDSQLVFDELGSPIGLADGESASTQWIDIAGRRQTYRVTVEAYTGRCTVALTRDLDAPAG